VQDIRSERTLVFVKPDGVQRGLVGEVLRRFERAGLKLVGLKMVWPDRKLLERHYPRDETFLKTIGGKTKEAFAGARLDVKKETGTDDPLEIGRQVRSWLLDYVSGVRLWRSSCKGFTPWASCANWSGIPCRIERHRGRFVGTSLPTRPPSPTR